MTWAVARVKVLVKFKLPIERFESLVAVKRGNMTDQEKKGKI